MRGEDKVYLRPTGLTIIPTFLRDSTAKRSALRTANIKQYFSNKTPNQSTDENNKTTISTETKKKIRNALNNLYAISDIKKCYDNKSKKSFTFKLNFITLTLSSAQKHDDNMIKKKLLEPFLKWAQYNHQLNSYIWKAETQKNGNIHFHITSNIFIHYKAIRDKWNQLQNSLGYIGPEWSMYDDDVPNSTDVHSVRNAKQCISYMIKYMTKAEPDKRKIVGQLWNCSKNLKQKPPVLLIDYIDDPTKFQEWRNKYSHHSFSNEYCEMIYSNHENMLRICEPFKTAYVNYIQFMKMKETTQKYFTLN